MKCECLQASDDYLDFYRFEHPTNGTMFLCDWCAAEAGFCITCGTYIGGDLTDVPQKVDFEDYGGIQLVSFGTVEICNKCAGTE